VIKTANGASIAIPHISIEEARGAVYCVLHRDTSRVYVGITTGSVSRRWKQHCYDAIEKNARRYFSEVIRKYGIVAFDVMVLEHGLVLSDLRKREEYYVAMLSANVHGCGFNTTAGGETPPSLDIRVRKKIADAQRGRILTPEWKAKLADAIRGKPKKPESIEKTAAARRGMKLNDAWRAALSEAHIGNRPSEETREKMADAHRRRHASNPRLAEASRKNMARLWAEPEYKKRVGDTIRKNADKSSRAVLVSINGEVKHFSGWCRDLGLKRNTIKARIRVCGWSVSRAFEVAEGAAFIVNTIGG
jgi:group I intron endonuclease